jgi:hypothetical protein
MVKLAVHAVSRGLQVISECCVKLQLWSCIAVRSVRLIYPSHVYSSDILLVFKYEMIHLAEDMARAK